MLSFKEFWQMTRDNPGRALFWFSIGATLGSSAVLLSKLF